MVRDAGALLNSLNPDTEEAVEPAWLDEIQRRAVELDSGAVIAVPWVEVDAKLRAVLTRGRQTLAFHPETGA